MKNANLIPAYRRAARARRIRLRRVIAAASVYLALVAAAYGFCLHAWGSDQASMQGQIEQVAQEVRLSQEAIASLKERIAVQQRKLVANKSVGNQPDWSKLLAVVAGQLSDEVFLRTVTLEPTNAAAAPDSANTVNPESLGPEEASGRTGGFVLTLSGVGKVQEDVWQFVLRMEKLGLFDSVKVKGSRGEVLNRERAVAFDVVCTLPACEPEEAAP